MQPHFCKILLFFALPILYNQLFSESIKIWESPQNIANIAEYNAFCSFYRMKNEPKLIKCIVGTFSGDIYTLDYKDNNFQNKKELINYSFFSKCGIPVLNNGFPNIAIGSCDASIIIFSGKSKYQKRISKLSSPKESCPVFVDIDNDGDYDLFSGNILGTIAFYKNTGSYDNPEYITIKDGSNKNGSFCNILVPGYSQVRFFDIDADGDLDMFVLSFNGQISFYQNNGTKQEFSFSKINFPSNTYEGIKLPENSYFDIFDIDNDSFADIIYTDITGRIYRIPSILVPDSYPVEKKGQAKENKENLILSSIQQAIKKYRAEKLAEFNKNIGKTKGQPIAELIKYIELNMDVSNEEIRNKINSLIDKIISDVQENPSSIVSEEITSLYINALKNIKSGKFKEALSKIQKIFKESPDAFNIQSFYYPFKKIYSQMEKNKESIPIYSKAVLEIKSGEIIEADKTLKELLSKNPNFSESVIASKIIKTHLMDFRKKEEFEKRYTDAENDYQAGKLNSSLTKFTALYRDFPDHPEINNKISSIEKELEISLSQKLNKKIEFFFNQAKTYMDNKLFSKALAAYKEIKKLNPNYPNIDNLIAIAKKESDKAAITITPQQKKMIQSLQTRAYTYFSKSNYAESYKTFKRILDIDPYNEKALKAIKQLEKIIH